jgi:hypothetical protein
MKRSKEQAPLEFRRMLTRLAAAALYGYNRDRNLPSYAQPASRSGGRDGHERFAEAGQESAVVA